MTSDIRHLGEQIAEDAAHLDAAHHRLLSNLRLFAADGDWHMQGFRSCAQWLSWRVGWTMGTAREHLRVAVALGQLPRIDGALSRGQLSYSKVRALTRVATPDNEEVLLEQALLTTGHQLETICRKYASVQRHDRDARHPADDAARRYVSRRDTDDGMVVIEAALHPDEAAVVWAALERLATERCRARPDTDRDASPSNVPAGMSAASSTDPVASPSNVPAGTSAATTATSSRQRPAFDRADALVHMAVEVVRGNRPQRAPTEIMISIPIDTLQDDNHDDPTRVACCGNGTVLSSHAARRLACDAGLVTVLEDGDGNAIAVGRKRRTIAGSMKRALLRRDQHCRFPGCHTRVFLEGHHIEHWANGGKTDLSNVVAVCSFHHRFVHEYGFTIELCPDGTVTAHDADGRKVPELPPSPAPRLRDLGWENITSRNSRLAITPDTIACWDGTLSITPS